VSTLDSETRTDVDSRLILDFMDVIILRLLRESICNSGYEMIRYFQRNYHLLVSSGTLYSMLYSLERRDLIDGNFDGRRRTYGLTKKGENFFKEICEAGQRNQSLFTSIFSKHLVAVP
jgi:DNA-binding PadR family transcriptional regulator